MRPSTNPVCRLILKLFNLTYLAGFILSFCWHQALSESHETSSEKVYVGTFINNLQALDLKNHSFAVDLYIWFRWKTEHFNPSDSIEFVNPHELWGQTSKASYSESKILESGERYQVLRVEGRFSNKFNLERYPYDKQLLSIILEDNLHQSSKIKFVLDTNPISLESTLKLPGFYLEKPVITLAEHTYPTNFGDPEPHAREYSRIRIEIPISRPKLTYTLKLLLPLLCVILCASLMCLLSPEWVDARIGMGITALLSLVALQITVNDELPEVDYLTLIDKLHLGAYLLTISCLICVVRTTCFLRRNELTSLVKTERVAFTLLNLLFFSYTALLLVL